MKSLRNPKQKPTHPGEVLREDVLPSLKMTQTELARRLGVSLLGVSELLLEKRALSPDIAFRVGSPDQYHAGKLAANAGSAVPVAA